MTKLEKKLYVHYGCGLLAPKDWANFDVSPTLRIQKIPILGGLLKSKLNTRFPANVLYGDIIKGLPIKESTCDGLYCSHTLAHLSLEDLRCALVNSYIILKPGGIFRCVLPDLEYEARKYIKDLDNGNRLASIHFLNSTLLGVNKRTRGVKGFISSFFGNANHLWMWDYLSLSEELKKVGFKHIRSCEFNDSKDSKFKSVEEEARFNKALAIECIK